MDTPLSKFTLFEHFTNCVLQIASHWHEIFSLTLTPFAHFSQSIFSRYFPLTYSIDTPPSSASTSTSFSHFDLHCILQISSYWQYNVDTTHFHSFSHFSNSILQISSRWPDSVKSPPRFHSIFFHFSTNCILLSHWHSLHRPFPHIFSLLHYILLLLLHLYSPHTFPSTFFRWHSSSTATPVSHFFTPFPHFSFNCTLQVGLPSHEHYFVDLTLPISTPLANCIPHSIFTPFLCISFQLYSSDTYWLKLHLPLPLHFLTSLQTAYMYYPDTFPSTLSQLTLTPPLISPATVGLFCRYRASNFTF